MKKNKIDFENIDFFCKWKDNAEAKTFFELLNEPTGGVIFLTGKAGSGKSTLINDIISFYKTQNQLPLVLGSTGISALNIGGQTVHSFFAFGIDDVFFKEIQYYIRDRDQKKYKLKKSKVEQIINAPFIVIDEISMLSSNILDSIDFLMRFYLALYTKNNDLTKIPFGGKKMIFVGDVYQLPPVKNDKWIEKFKNEYKSERFFHSKVFSRLVRDGLRNSIKLQKNYRQDSDKHFSEILDSIRTGDISDNDIQLLNKVNKLVHDDTIMISTHRHKVDKENKSQLSKLEGDEKIFYSSTDGIYPDYMKRTDDELVLKVGAKVMMLTNDSSGYRVNGSIGTIAGFDDEIIYVKLNGNVYPIGQNTRENTETFIDDDGSIIENIIGTYTQFPLKLAYAITVHKSQGMTFDRCRLDVANIFAGGQAYTALSRAKSLSGISMIGKLHIGDLYFDDCIKEFVEKYI